MRYSLSNEVISFNITPTCNLNCNGCFIGSNFDYQGHSSWKEQQPIYEKWSKKLNINCFEIYGGEPFLNPEWYDWFTGVSKLWPNARGWITSNGYAISAKKNQRLYDLLKKSEGRYWLEISHHNTDKYDWLIEQIYKFLGDGVVKSFLSAREFWARRGIEFDAFSGRNDIYLTALKTGYNDVKDVNWPEVNSIEDWYNLPDWIKQECAEKHGVSTEKVIERYSYIDKISIYTDKNGVIVIVRGGGTVFSDGVLSIHDHGMSFQNSDEQRAHDACFNNMCLEFYNGSIHKCSSAGHFKEWSEQLPIELTEKQRQLIDSYTPLTTDSTVEEITQWFEHDRYQSMPQCSLCPEERKIFEIQATTKKIKFVR